MASMAVRAAAAVDHSRVSAVFVSPRCRCRCVAPCAFACFCGVPFSAPLAVPFQVSLWVVPPARLRALPGMQYVELPAVEGALSPSAVDKVGSYPVAQVRSSWVQLLFC